MVEGHLQSFAEFHANTNQWNSIKSEPQLISQEIVKCPKELRQ